MKVSHSRIENEVPFFVLQADSSSELVQLSAAVSEVKQQLMNCVSIQNDDWNSEVYDNG